MSSLCQPSAFMGSALSPSECVCVCTCVCVCVCWQREVRGASATSSTLALREAIIHDLMQGKIPLSCLPLLPLRSSSSWALPLHSCSLNSSHTVSRLRQERGNTQSDSGWTDRRRAAEGKVSLRSRTPLIACGLLRRPHRWECKFVGGVREMKTDEWRNSKEWKSFLHLLSIFRVLVMGHSIIHLAEGRETPQTPCQSVKELYIKTIQHIQMLAPWLSRSVHRFGLDLNISTTI